MPALSRATAPNLGAKRKSQGISRDQDIDALIDAALIDAALIDDALIDNALIDDALIDDALIDDGYIHVPHGIHRRHVGAAFLGRRIPGRRVIVTACAREERGHG